jgi:hypothetical protein
MVPTNGEEVRSGTRGIIVSVINRTFGLVGILLVGCVAQFAAEQHHSNVICREEVSTASREELARRLSLITGWPGLRFDDQGSLRVGEASPIGGSVTARNLMSRALTGNTILIIEDASNRSDVAFSRVVSGRWKNNVAAKVPLFVVLIDFADFEHLMGDGPAREAFNVGWGVLHEIDHVVTDSVDAEGLGRAGECEDHINQMRRECHLPERTEYFFTFFPHSEESEFKTKLVRLAFDRKDVSARKHRRYWLMWDATQVGGLPETRQIASLR